MADHSHVLAWRIPTDRGIWQATVHGVMKSQTQLSDSVHILLIFCLLHLLIIEMQPSTLIVDLSLSPPCSISFMFYINILTLLFVAYTFRIAMTSWGIYSFIIMWCLSSYLIIFCSKVYFASNLFFVYIYSGYIVDYICFFNLLR